MSNAVERRPAGGSQSAANAGGGARGRLGTLSTASLCCPAHPGHGDGQPIAEETDSTSGKGCRDVLVRKGQGTWK